MSWLFFAILVRVLWAAMIVGDQYVVRYFRGPGGLGAAALLQNLLCLPFALGLIMLHGWPPLPDWKDGAWIAAGALAYAAAVLPYLRASQMENAHDVTPLSGLGPLFVILLAWLVFGETMHRWALAGAALTTVAGCLFLWDGTMRNFKMAPALLVLLSSFLYAVYQFCMRPAGLRLPAESVTVYFQLGVFAFSVITAAFRPAWCKALYRATRQGGRHVIAINVGTAIAGGLAALAMAQAMRNAPAAGDVAAVGGTLSIFVFAMSWMAGHLGLPHYERMTWTAETKLKLALLPVLGAGIALLNF